jgi:restriction system protein
MLSELTLDELKKSAKTFANHIHAKPIPELFGASDGKAVGTYVEQNFRAYLNEKYIFIQGNSASGIDLPSLAVDLKATSIKQPQSYCPFKDASQKVYGLGYHLLIFVYDKEDDSASKSAKLHVHNVIFVSAARTGDFQTTRGILEILQRDGNQDDLTAFLEDKNFPLDDIGRENLAMRILQQPPLLGYLTISNALQWRLQYSRAINTAFLGTVDGVENLYA